MGAAVAYAMARRGWSVTVLDSHTHCAMGGSGLPVGLLVPHVSVDDSPRSRLSRVGISLTLQHARRLLRRGEDWDDVGALELTRDAQRQLDASPSLIQAGWLEPGSRQATAQPWADGVDWAHSLWHPRAGWIKPERLVRAWLSAPGIEWRGGAPVCRMERVKTVEIDGAFIIRSGLAHGDARAQLVIGCIFERNNHVQAIHGAALKYHDQGLVFCRLRLRGTDEKRRW